MKTSAPEQEDQIEAQLAHRAVPDLEDSSTLVSCQGQSLGLLIFNVADNVRGCYCTASTYVVATLFDCSDNPPVAGWRQGWAKLARRARRKWMLENPF